MRRVWIVVASILAFGAVNVRESSAQATFATFMLIPQIPGESTDRSHARWIDVISLRQTADRETTSSPGAAQTNANVACEIEIIKFLDAAGPPIWAAAVTGQVFSEIQIEVVHQNSGDVRYKLKLVDARISSISTATEGAFPLDRVVLTMASATLTYTPIDDRGPRAPITSMLDCAGGGRRAA